MHEKAIFGLTPVEKLQEAKSLSVQIGIRVLI